MQGNDCILQGPKSSVKLHIPQDLDAVAMGHAHTDVKPFLHVIPEGECLVSPVAEYHYTAKKTKYAWFRLQIPHCVKKKEHLRDIIVRHGDIHKDVPFSEVPRCETLDTDCYYEVDEKHIIIYTTHFSQFTCTLCKKVCCGDGKAFIFGGLSPLAFTPLTAALRLYMCSPLYKIDDYRLVSVNTDYLPKVSLDQIKYTRFDHT